MHFEFYVKQQVISPYAILLIASLMISFGIAVLLMIRKKFPQTLAVLSAMLNMTTALYFGYLYTALATGEFTRVRFSSMGGVAGVLLGVFILGKVFPEYRAELRKGYIVVLPLTYGISKIGCFLAGCCYGLPYNGPFYVKYHGDMVYVSEMALFPVQLAETVVFILIFLVGYYWAYVKDLENATILILCVCALAKFLLDYLRASHTNQILSMNQIACIIVAALTIVYFFYHRVHRGVNR